MCDGTRAIHTPFACLLFGCDRSIAIVTEIIYGRRMRARLRRFVQYDAPLCRPASQTTTPPPFTTEQTCAAYLGVTTMIRIAKRTQQGDGRPACM